VQHQARHVLLTGYATDMCFCRTTAGYENLAKDFNVFLVGDATLATFRSVLGYVPQDDIIHTDLPLARTLRSVPRRLDTPQGLRGMSAMPPIAPELMRWGELTRW